MFIYIYCSNDIWNKYDLTAINKHYKSGNNSKTASINGIGIKMVLKAILDCDGICSYTVVNEENNVLNNKLRVNKNDLQKSGWKKLNKDNNEYKKYIEELDIIKKMYPKIKNIKMGTFIKIDLNDKWFNEFDENKVMITKYTRKIFNRSPIEKISLFDKKLEIQPLSKNPIKLKLAIFWDTSDQTLTKSTLEYGKWLNYNEIKKYFPKLVETFRITGRMLQDDIITEYKPEVKTPIKKDKIELYYSLIDAKAATEQKKEYGNTTSIRGMQIYFNNTCLTPKGFLKNLGTRSSTNSLGKQTWGQEGEELHERFEMNILNKNSTMVNMPHDKKNLKQTRRGEKMNKIMFHIAKLHPYVKNKNDYKSLTTPSDKAAAPAEEAPAEEAPAEEAPTEEAPAEEAQEAKALSLKKKDKISLTSQQKLDLFKRDFWTPEIVCPSCNDQMFWCSGIIDGKNFKKITKSLIIPESLGGKKNLNNIIHICEDCKIETKYIYLLDYIKKTHPDNIRRFNRKYNAQIKININEHALNPEKKFDKSLYK